MAHRAEWTDPRTLGAECDRCPLGPNAPFRRGDGPEWAPVVGEGDAPYVIVAQTPEREEINENRPLIGAFGVEVSRAVRAWGGRRDSVAWDNVIACMPPGGDWRRFELKLRAANRKRARQGRDPFPSPLECCAPRLRRRLRNADGVVPMGAAAYKAVTGSSAAIQDVRGTIAEVDCRVDDADGTGVLRRLKVAPTVASFLHRRRWLKIMQHDVIRALNWFHDRLGWTDPIITITRDVATIRAFFDARRGTAAVPAPLLVDVETDGVYARKTAMRCIGFGDATHALVIPVVDLDGTPLWSPGHERSLCRYLCARMREPGFAMMGHNANYFDRIVIESWSARVLGQRQPIRIVHDTIAAASVIMPEHPKTLAFHATVHSAEGTPAWKADHTAVSARDMNELGTYNGLDDCINFRIAGPMLDRVKAAGQEKPYRVLMGMQEVCAGFHQAGLPVDIGRQQRMLAWVREAEKHYRNDVRKAMAQAGMAPTGFGKPKRKGDECLFNPNSPDHLRELIFVRWGFLPPASLPIKDCFTDGDEYSVAKKVLIALQYDAQCNEQQRNVIRRLLVYKRWAKRRSTIEGLGVRHWDGAIYAGAVGASRVIAPGRMINKRRPDGSTYPVRRYIGHTDPETHRVHASWNAHGTNVSRVSCSGPNLVNVEKLIRHLFVAPDGYSFVGADWSALHFRLMAAFWQIPRLVESSTVSADYPDGKDAHALLAGAIFGDAFWNAPGHPDPKRPALIGDYSGPAKKMRTPIKAFGYSMGYDASPTTIYRVMASQMTDDGARAFPDITPKLVENFHAATMEREPEWRQNWQRTRDFWRTHGYLAEPVNGRKCWFEDGYTHDGILTDAEADDEILGNVGNQIPNFEILGAEGSFASNVTLDFVDAVPFDYAGVGTGLVHQNYDSLLALVPDHDADRVRGVMEDTMNRTIRGIRMIAKAARAQTWAAAG